MTTRRRGRGSLAERASDATGRMHELAEAVVATVREPLIVLDRDYSVLTANQAFYDTFQVDPEETTDRPLFELGNGQWNITQLRARLEDVLTHATHFSDFEVEHDFDHLGARTMLLNARRLARVEGMDEMILLAIEDVTDRKAWQEKEARLERRVSERTRALEATKRALERRNRELQEFAYVASHDLQEPLRKVGAFAGLLRDDQADRLDEDGLHFLERIEDAASRMTTLIEDLLAFSRVTTEDEPAERIALGDVVGDVVDDLAFQIDAAGADVEVGALPDLEADPLQMRQLFQNLISNALKYQPEDRAPRIRIDAESAGNDDGDRWIIRVADNGIGFEEAYKERIFTPFKRLHGRDAYDGTGMGLAICRRIVERHAGTITAEATPGEGATFVIDLPDRQPGPHPISE